MWAFRTQLLSMNNYWIIISLLVLFRRNLVCSQTLLLTWACIAIRCPRRFQLSSVVFLSFAPRLRARTSVPSTSFAWLAMHPLRRVWLRKLCGSFVEFPVDLLYIIFWACTASLTLAAVDPICQHDRPYAALGINADAGACISNVKESFLRKVLRCRCWCGPAIAVWAHSFVS